MAPCTMTVRNTCPFKVTFYALGGPVFCEIEPGETVRSEACAIWFSTRVQGPGTIFYSEEWESLKQNYKDNANEFSGEAIEWEDGGSGALAGSILGVLTMNLCEVFKLHNTKQSIGNGTSKYNIYYADKMEGVYGNSNLLIYATLDPACSLTPANPEKIWNLHLVRDNGQESPGVVVNAQEDLIPVYVEPDLTSYESSMFFRLRNKTLVKRMYAADNLANIHLREIDVPFDPINFAEYWAILPAQSGQQDLKIVNIKSNKWLTQFSSELDDNWIGLYSAGCNDELDQHWRVEITGKESYDSHYMMTLNNLKTEHFLCSDGDNVYGAVTVYGSSFNEVWIVETMCVNLENIPDGIWFRIMQASTGKYLTNTTGSCDVVLESLRDHDSCQDFCLQRMQTDAHPDGFLLVKTSVGTSTYRMSSNNDKLSINGDANLSNDVWVFSVAGNRAGLRLINPTSGGILTYKNGAFTMQTDESKEPKEQLFVIQLEKYK